jgi:hypothetical protein
MLARWCVFKTRGYLATCAAIARMGGRANGLRRRARRRPTAGAQEDYAGVEGDGCPTRLARAPPYLEESHVRTDDANCSRPAS